MINFKLLIFRLKWYNIKYLPLYSPDLNPIEKKWAQIKKLYRKMTHNFEDKVKLIDRLLIDNSYQEFS